MKLRRRPRPILFSYSDPGSAAAFAHGLVERGYRRALGAEPEAGEFRSIVRGSRFVVEYRESVEEMTASYMEESAWVEEAIGRYRRGERRTSRSGEGKCLVPECEDPVHNSGICSYHHHVLRFANQVRESQAQMEIEA